MKRLLITIICLALFLSGGCATIITGKYQKISISSSPPTGVLVKTDGKTITTPGSFNLYRNRNHILVAEYEGRIQQKELKRKLQGWFWGNILAFGFIGGAVDSSTGAAYRLTPGSIHFNFEE